MGKLLQQRRERRANEARATDAANADIRYQRDPERYANLADLAAFDYDAELEAAIQRNLAANMTPKEAQAAANDELRGRVRELQALSQGATPEAAARERERAQGNDFRSRIQRKRDTKQERAAEQRRLAEESMQQNVDQATELAGRDYGESALADLTADPMLQAAQMDALGRWDQLSREGYTDLDRQAINQAQTQAAQFEQSQRGAALDAAARRGDASGGNALMASLMAQQGGANRANADATNVALEGRNRALQALGQYGNMAGDMRAQQFGERAQVGGAVDQFNQWAAGNSLAAQSQLANMRNMQTQYQLIRAGELKPKNAGEIVGDVVNYGQQLGGLVAGAVGLGGDDQAQPAAGGASAAPSFQGKPAMPTGSTKSRQVAGTNPLRRGGFGGSY